MLDRKAEAVNVLQELYRRQGAALSLSSKVMTSLIIIRSLLVGIEGAQWNIGMCIYYYFTGFIKKEHKRET